MSTYELTAGDVMYDTVLDQHKTIDRVDDDWIVYEGHHSPDHLEWVASRLEDGRFVATLEQTVRSPESDLVTVEMTELQLRFSNTPAAARMEFNQKIMSTLILLAKRLRDGDGDGARIKANQLADQLVAEDL